MQSHIIDLGTFFQILNGFLVGLEKFPAVLNKMFTRGHDDLKGIKPLQGLTPFFTKAAGRAGIKDVTVSIAKALIAFDRASGQFISAAGKIGFKLEILSRRTLPAKPFMLSI